MKKVVEYTVLKENFANAKLFPYLKIPFIEKSCVDDTKKFDFIIIRWENSKVLRNFLECNHRMLSYTDCFHTDSSDFSLKVVTTLLYDSIMWLRHGTYFQTKQFHPIKFSKNQVEQEVHFIENILLLYEETIKLDDFINILVDYEKQKEEFLYPSAIDILTQNGFSFDITNLRRERLDRIKKALYEIKCNIQDRKKWEQIHKIAYSIHNEPYFIFNNSLE